MGAGESVNGRPYIWMGEDHDAHVVDFRRGEARKHSDIRAEIDEHNSRIMAGMMNLSNIRHPRIDLNLATGFSVKTSALTKIGSFVGNM